MVALTEILDGEKLESKILKKMHERIIKNFMDIIIMTELRNASLRRLRRHLIHTQQIQSPS